MPNTKPNTTYGQRLDFLYKNYSKKKLFELLKEQCSKLGSPFSREERRGRQLKFSSETYVAYLAIQKIFGHAYREMELEADLYLPYKADHSTFARNYAKISQEYLERLIASLVNREFSFWLVDSTKMSTKVRVERVRQGIRNKTKLTDKYHILVGYDPSKGITMIINAKATCDHVSDSQGAVDMLEGKKSHAWLLGDSGYNSYALH